MKVEIKGDAYLYDAGVWRLEGNNKSGSVIITAEHGEILTFNVDVAKHRYQPNFALNKDKKIGQSTHYIGIVSSAVPMDDLVRYGWPKGRPESDKVFIDSVEDRKSVV